MRREDDEGTNVRGSLTAAQNIEDAKDVVEMVMVEDQEPVETLRADGAHFWSVANFFASRWSCAPLKGVALPVWLYSPQGWQSSFLWVSRHRLQRDL